jgi:hypothetical protein
VRLPSASLLLSHLSEFPVIRRIYSVSYPWQVPSMRRPVSVKSVFLPSCGYLEFEPSRLCRHPSIRTLLLSDFRSVQGGRSHFSRCCYLIIDLGSHLFDRSWARH